MPVGDRCSPPMGYDLSLPSIPTIKDTMVADSGSAMALIIKVQFGAGYWVLLRSRISESIMIPLKRDSS